MEITQLETQVKELSEEIKRLSSLGINSKSLTTRCFTALGYTILAYFTLAMIFVVLALALSFLH